MKQRIGLQDDGVVEGRRQVRVVPDRTGKNCKWSGRRSRAIQVQWAVTEGKCAGRYEVELPTRVDREAGCLRRVRNQRNAHAASAENCGPQVRFRAGSKG